MLTCRHCGEVNPDRARFCVGCGTAFASDALPVEVRRVSVLFADIAGSTAMIAGTDPDDAQALLDGIVRTMREAVHEYGGVVTRVAGDGIVALFGAPVAAEDHACRACWAALRLLSDVSRVRANAGRGGAGPVRIRIGINSGDALLRSVSSDLHQEYSAEGETTHLAAKAQQAAAPGTALVTAEVARLVEGFVQTSPHKPLFLDGLSKPVALFRLLGATSAQTRFEVALERGLARLVGREAELDRLEHAARNADGGTARMVGVVGDPGVGKSRLIWELGRRLEARQWRVVATRSTVGGARSAFLPLLAVLRALHDIGPGDDADAICRKLVGAGGGEVPDLPPLRVLLGQPSGETRWGTLDDFRRRARTHRALRSVLLEACRDRPTAIVIDDLHEGDSETREFLLRFARHARNARLLVVLEYRSGFGVAFKDAPCFDEVRVDPLGRQMAVELFRELAGSGGALPGVAEAVIDRAAGNAFFIEESVRMLAEVARLSEAAGADTARAAGSALPIPGSVKDVLEARIASLQKGDRDVLKLAAIFGREIHLPILEQLARTDEASLRAVLGRLADAGLMTHATAAKDDELAFKHAITQDVAYRMVHKAERRAAHARIVAALESPAAAALAGRIELLARHSTKAQDWERAVAYAQRAAGWAAERAAFSDAVRVLDDALDLVPNLPSPSRRTETEIDLRLAMRWPLLALGETVRVAHEVRRLEKLEPRCVDGRRLARVAVYVSGQRWLSGQHSKAVIAGMRAMALAHEQDEDTVTIPARLYVGGALHELGRFDEADALLTANVVGVPEDAPGQPYGMAGLPAVFCRATRAWLGLHTGDFTRATSDAETALRLAEAAGNTFSVMSATFAVGSLYLARGEFERAREFLAQALASSEAHRLLMWQRILGPLHALALAGSGERAAALKLVERTTSRDLGGALMSSTMMLSVAETYAAMGSDDIAARLAASALRRARNLGEKTWEAVALWLVGSLAVRAATPNLDAAQAAHTKGLRLAEELGMRPFAARCRLGLASVLAQGGLAESASQYAERAAAEFAALELPYWTRQAHELRAGDAGS